MNQNDYDLLKRSEEIVIIPYKHFLDIALQKTIEGLEYISKEYREEIDRIEMELTDLKRTPTPDMEEYLDRMAALFIDFARITQFYNENILIYEKWFAEFHGKFFCNMESARMNPVYDKLNKTINGLLLGEGKIKSDRELVDYLKLTINTYRGYKQKVETSEKLLSEIEHEKLDEISKTMNSAKIALRKLNLAVTENDFGSNKVERILGVTINRLNEQFKVLVENQKKQADSTKLFCLKSSKSIANRKDVMNFLFQFDKFIPELEDMLPENATRGVTKVPTKKGGGFQM